MRPHDLKTELQHCNKHVPFKMINFFFKKSPMLFSFLSIANKVMEAIAFSCKAGGISILLLGEVCLEVGGDTLRGFEQFVHLNK